MNKKKITVKDYLLLEQKYNMMRALLNEAIEDGYVDEGIFSSIAKKLGLGAEKAAQGVQSTAEGLFNFGANMQEAGQKLDAATEELIKNITEYCKQAGAVTMDNLGKVYTSTTQSVESFMTSVVNWCKEHEAEAEEMGKKVFDVMKNKVLPAIGAAAANVSLVIIGLVVLAVKGTYTLAVKAKEAGVKIAGAAADWFKQVFESVKKTLTDMREKAFAAYEGAKDAAEDKAKEVAASTRQWALSMIACVMSAGQAAGAWVKGVMDEVSKLASQAVDEIKGKAGAAKLAIAEFISATKNKVVTSVKGAAEAVANAISGVAQEVKDKCVEAYNKVVQGLKDAKDEAGAIVANAVTKGGIGVMKTGIKILKKKGMSSEEILAAVKQALDENLYMNYNGCYYINERYYGSGARKAMLTESIVGKRAYTPKVY